MGLSWQQGPLAPGAAGRFLVPDPLPERMLFAEPLRRRMRVRFGGAWIADSEDVVLLHEPGRYPVAYFPRGDVSAGVLEPSGYRTRHRDLGDTSWFTVHAGSPGSSGASGASGGSGASGASGGSGAGGGAGAEGKQRAAWEHTGLPDYAGELKGRVAFAWRAMDAFCEEDERIVGHAADAYHRIDIRRSGRHLTVRSGDRAVADTTRPLALYESGFAPRWYVPRADVDESALTQAPLQTFCPYKGVCSYWDIGDARQAAWSYLDAFTEVGRVSGLMSFEPDKIEVHLDGARLRLEPGQGVIPHGVDRNLDLDESGPGRKP